jgi:hypothetical protein
MIHPDVKKQIKVMALREPDLRLDQIQVRLHKNKNVHVSKIMIANVRGQFRHSLKLLLQDGIIDPEALQALRRKYSRKYSQH